MLLLPADILALLAPFALLFSRRTGLAAPPCVSRYSSASSRRHPHRAMRCEGIEVHPPLHHELALRRVSRQRVGETC